jgi:hypothetical protein
MSSATRRTASLLPSSACWANARYLAIFISSNTRSFRTLLDMASANGFFAKRTICKSVHAQHIRSFLKFGAKPRLSRLAGLCMATPQTLKATTFGVASMARALCCDHCHAALWARRPNRTVFNWFPSCHRRHPMDATQNAKRSNTVPNRT